MHFVYKLKTGPGDGDFFRVVATNVDEALHCLRSIRGVETQVIEVSREHMGLGLTGDRDTHTVDYVAGLDGVE